MSKINLLPWREEVRNQRSRYLMIGSVSLWVISALVVLGVSQFVTHLQEVQNARNGFLRGEISKLDDEIKEIQELRERRDRLVSRMEVIQELQRDRTELVQVMDELVRLQPDGVYFSKMEIKGKKMKLIGRAQSNTRVSALMRNLEDSALFHNPNLNIIDVIEDAEGKLSQFDLGISRVGRQLTAEERFNEG
ncbi:MAG: type IV pilus assembly protein PilN [Parasphingorhabdus sp.]